MALEIKKSPLTSEVKAHIFTAFSRHAIQSTGIDGLAEDPLSFELREDDQPVGWVVVQLFWGQLHIKYLLVEDAYRGRGYGRKLMDLALEYGRERGCHYAFVETMNFQAPEFYQKMGFEIEMKREGMSQGTSFCYLKRDL
jgi:ribosomal protein S18 acetylase RimI-like enzyme